MKIVLVALSAMVAGAYSAPALRTARSLADSERKCVSSHDFPIQNKSQTPDEWCALQGGVHCVADNFCPSYCHWDSGPECGADTGAPTPKPTPAPTSAPTRAPTSAPTRAPTSAPTRAPTSAPTRAPTSAPTRAPTQSIKCDTFENAWTDKGDGSGAYIYLDRQNVECSNNGVLRGFHLETNWNSNSIKYHYECCTGLADSSASPIALTTPWNDQGDNFFWLDRHDVRCPPQSVLSRFHLHRSNDHSKIQYEYTCTPVTSNGHFYDCSQTTTASTFDGSTDDDVGFYEFLDRQTPACIYSNEMMAGFRLVREPVDRIAYEVDCCKYYDSHSSVQCDTFENAWTDAGDDPNHSHDSYVYLDRQNVECSNNGVLRGFHLETNRDLNSDSIKYQYECCTGLADSSASPIALTTPWNDQGDNYLWLDRHDVRCPPQSVLSRFHLHRSDDHSKIQYEYTCTPANRKDLYDCSQTTTAMTDGVGSYNYLYLYRQTPACIYANEVMTGFRLVRGPDDSIAYEVDCCKYYD